MENDVELNPSSGRRVVDDEGNVLMRVCGPMSMYACGAFIGALKWQDKVKPVTHTRDTVTRVAMDHFRRTS